MARAYGAFFHEQSSTIARIGLIVVLAVLAHVLINAITIASEWLVTVTQRQKEGRWFVGQQQKFTTLIRLIASTLTWVIYFVAIGLFLEECRVNLTAYLASASVIGLAISFGSQGLVQDMVIGLTLIFSNAMDVDDMVEISGSVVVVGRVLEIGLRFTKVINLYNQIVFIPNRTVANVSRFPSGGIYAYVDVQIPQTADAQRVGQVVKNVADGTWRQFNGIVLAEPTIDAMRTADANGWDFLRVRFKIWPGQGGLIETTFRQQILSAMRALDSNYAEWQVPVIYRAMRPPEARPTPPAA